MIFGFTVARQERCQRLAVEVTHQPTPKGGGQATQEPRTVAFVLYRGLTLLDLVGPLQVFASLQRFSDQYRPVVVAERLEPWPPTAPSP